MMDQFEIIVHVYIFLADKFISARISIVLRKVITIIWCKDTWRILKRLKYFVIIKTYTIELSVFDISFKFKIIGSLKPARFSVYIIVSFVEIKKLA